VTGTAVPSKSSGRAHAPPVVTRGGWYRGHDALVTIDQRPAVPQIGDERPMLSAYLDFQRATLEMKCAGLSDEQLRERAVPPSTLSLLGLVRHLTDVERIWFVVRFARREAPAYYSTDNNLDGDFNDLDYPPVDEVFARWRSACAESREIVARTSTLDELGVRGDGSSASLRWILLHLIEEYARHNGHADLLRERIDGTTGAQPRWPIGGRTERIGEFAYCVTDPRRTATVAASVRFRRPSFERMCAT
jgi:Protein of unknown function (DUF664)